MDNVKPSKKSQVIDATKLTNVSKFSNDAAGLESLGERSNHETVKAKVVSTKNNFQFIKKINIYLLLFILLIIIAIVIIFATYFASKNLNNQHYQSQGLNTNTLQQIANGDTTVGNNQTVLNIQSSAVFAGQVLIKQRLDVAGNLQVGGTTNLTDLNVSGASQFGQTSISKNLNITGDEALQGTITVGKSLQVSGTGTFSGAVSAPQVTAGSLNLSGDLVLSHHISVSGALPGRTNGSVLGGGGSSSVSGTDAAGSISINTGNGPAAGCFVTINFTSHYSSTPHVLITPIGSSAGGIAYFVNRSTTNFSICDASTPPANTSFGFDYFILD